MLALSRVKNLGQFLRNSYIKTDSQFKTIFKNPSHKSFMKMTKTRTKCSVSFVTIGSIYLCKILCLLWH